MLRYLYPPLWLQPTLTGLLVEALVLGILVFSDVRLSQEELIRGTRLLIEVTETAAVSDLTDAQRFISTLQASGCGVCRDDFGTGFAWFAYLKPIRVDTIKIDGMFIRDLPHDREDQVFVHAMMEAARGLGRRTVAEFVAGEATLNLLADLGVDLARGYYLGHPQAGHPALHRCSGRHRQTADELAT
jgi:EAL domain-containing protein (putative c-di-GMP-specific phosphodiesterase class I)